MLKTLLKMPDKLTLQNNKNFYRAILEPSPYKLLFQRLKKASEDILGSLDFTVFL